MTTSIFHIMSLPSQTRPNSISFWFYQVGKQAAKLQADVLEKTVEGTPIQAPLKAARAEVESVLSAVEGTRPEMESRLSETLSKSIDTSTAAAQQVTRKSIDVTRV